MEEVTQEVQEVQEVVQETPEVKAPVIYPIADLMLECSCGHKTLLNANVPEGAMRYEVYTVEGSYLPIQCEKCEHKFTISFSPAANPPVEDEQPAIEPVQEADATTSEDDSPVESRDETAQETEEKEVEHESVPQERQA